MPRKANLERPSKDFGKSQTRNAKQVRTQSRSRRDAFFACATHRYKTRRALGMEHQFLLCSIQQQTSAKLSLVMIQLNTLVVLSVAIYAVVARPTESSIKSTTTLESAESVDVRQGWSQGQKYANSYPIGQSGTGYYSNPAVATGSYPAGNTRPAYAYDNAFPDQVNFAGADAHRGIASMFTIPNGGLVSNPVRNQVAGFAPTGYQAQAGVSASASAISVSS